MPSYTVPNDVVEDLVAAYRGVVPGDIADPNRSDASDDIYALAEMMAIGECMIRNWNRMAIVSTSEGPYLEALARGDGLFIQSGESDEALRERIRTPPLAVTPDLILQALQQIVDGVGGGQVFLIELPARSPYFSRSGFLNRRSRMGSSNGQLVIALVPLASGAASSVAAALASKVTAGKSTLVEEYS